MRFQKIRLGRYYEELYNNGFGAKVQEYLCWDMRGVRAVMRYKYKCTQPDLPQNAKSPVMDNRDMESWLNLMDKQGWEFVGYTQKHWVGQEPFIQDWWVFKQPRP